MSERYAEFAAQMAALTELLGLPPTAMTPYGPLREEHLEAAFEGDLMQLAGIETQLGYTLARAALRSRPGPEEEKRARRILEEMIYWYPSGAARIRFERGVRMGLRTS